MMKYYSNVLYSEDRINLHYIATTSWAETRPGSVREAWCYPRSDVDITDLVGSCVYPAMPLSIIMRCMI
jgi:hypothetical protein